jgi:hypothetical protein
MDCNNRKASSPRVCAGSRPEASLQLQSLTFLSQHSLRHCPRAKRSYSHTRAGLVGYLFEAAHKAIAPMWQPGSYIRPCELSSIVEGTYSNVARETKRWLEPEIRHAAETRKTSL